MKHDHILLGHGSGGQLTHELIDSLFVKYFKNDILDNQTDSALLTLNGGQIAFTTDSFVVDPIFFPGGDIGKLAVAGTVNDLAVSGAKPLWLSAGFIIEEGLPFPELEKVVKSMAGEAKKAGVTIVTGDTKVVDRGKCDKVFINTSGIGLLDPRFHDIGSGKNITVGDKIIINGSIGDHGMTIMSKRKDLNISSEIRSDCASLNGMIAKVLEVCPETKFMRDATRGGISTVLTEIVSNKPYGVEIDETAVPVHENVRGICEMLGFDPFYVANEGKVVIVAPAGEAEKIVEVLKTTEEGKEAAIIGEITSAHPGKGWITTGIGGRRVLDMLAGEQLPRIC